MEFNIKQFKFKDTYFSMHIQQEFVEIIEHFWRELSAGTSLRICISTTLKRLENKEDIIYFYDHILPVLESIITSSINLETSFGDKQNDYAFSMGRTISEMMDSKHVYIHQMSIDSRSKLVHIGMEHNGKTNTLVLPLAQCENINLINFDALQKAPIKF